MTPQEEVTQGEAAKQLLDNPLLKAAFDEVEKNLVRTIKASPLGDEKTHNRLAIALQLLQQIEKAITIHIETGKMAQMQVNDSLSKKVRNILR